MEPVFGDVDGDDDVDLDEATTLAECLSGPDAAVLPAPCSSLPFRGGDLDADGFVDLRDVALFQLIYAPP